MISIKISEKNKAVLKQLDAKVTSLNAELQDLIKQKQIVIQSFQEQKKMLLGGIISQSDYPETTKWKLNEELDLEEVSDEEREKLLASGNASEMEVDLKPEGKVKKLEKTK